MIELIVFREAFFYAAYTGVQCLIAYAVHLTTPHTTLSLARLACTVQFVWFACLLVLTFAAAGLLGIDIDSIQMVTDSTDEKKDKAEKKETNETTAAACDGVLQASTAVTAGVFVALLTGTVVCMHAGGAAVCVETSGGQYALGFMCLLLVMQAQLLVSSAITSNIQRGERALLPTLVLGTLVFACTTAEIILVLPGIKYSSTWLGRSTAVSWVVLSVLQIVYVSCCSLRALYYPTLDDSKLDRVLFLWLPALAYLLLFPAYFLFTNFDAASAGLVYAPVATGAVLCLICMALAREQSPSSARKLE